MKNVGLLVTVALAGLVLLAVVLPEREPELQVAPVFRLENLEGEPVSLSEFRGRVVVIDFWATWCAPCLRSFPALHALITPLQERGVILLTVSLDRTAERAREYLVDNGYETRHALWGSLDEARAVRDLYRVVGIPRTIVVDREGLIRFSGHPGQLREEDLLPWLE